jgi:hypothetical protein
MVVAHIQNHLAAYKKWLQDTRHHPHTHWWETAQHWQLQWQPEAADGADMFDRCLQNSVTRRLWQSDTWQPKAIIQQFWRFDAGMVRAMFDDLFDETRAIEARVSRFQFGLDTLLDAWRRAHPTSIENNHYHDDYRAIALYLACRYPESYAAPYDLPRFGVALERLGARDLPQADDLPRFFKAHRTLMTFIDKDPDIGQAMARHLDPRKHWTGRSMLLAADFTHFVAGEPLRG